ncbi:MAG: hypothetical protein NC299_12985 [Lachnospiraceae bacterium]|nr:hypothetical protein [Ruminococcus sp.]MCM1276253.1 hypothetical protein [Lachnospiraceae bacterium]
MNPGILELESNPEAQKAYDYFGVLKTSETASVNDDTKITFSGVNSCGMVDFVQMFNQAADSTADGSDDNLTSVMESLSNILIAAVLKHAGSSEEQQVSSKNWQEGFNAMAGLFFSTYSVDELKYSDKKVGKDVVEEVIKVAFDVNGQPEGNLKAAIEKYLQKQGKLMDTLSFNSAQQSDPYTLMGFVNFVKDNTHTCSLRAYFTNFTTDTVKISHSCSDDEKKFDFDFKVTHCNADFMLTKWNTDSDFRDRVNKFIKDHTPGSSYFDDLETSHTFTVT